jgi:hypothetical protein
VLPMNLLSTVISAFGTDDVNVIVEPTAVCCGAATASDFVAESRSGAEVAAATGAGAVTGTDVEMKAQAALIVSATLAVVPYQRIAPSLSWTRFAESTDIIASEPLLEQEGSSGRNHLRLGGISDFDMAVSKSFRITESKSFQLRWEAYNILNHSNFGGYINNLANLANGTFNTYTATSTVNRQFQIAGKFVF